MTTTINASTSSGLVVTPDNSGNVLLQYNGVAAPAFSVGTTGSSIPNTTWTKVTLNQEEFDTANAFDATTNYRFQPTIAGYYQMSGAVGFTFSSGWSVIAIRKNGTATKFGNNPATAGPNGSTSLVSALVYLNGSTDYLELWVYQAQGTTQSTITGYDTTFFTGCLLRGA
jgi:hypothetical protein